MEMQETEFDPWVGKIPWRRKWQSTPVLLPGKSHEQRSLVGYSLWVAKSQTCLTDFTLGFPGGSDSKAPVYNAGDRVQALGWEDPLEKEMAIHSSTTAWKIPCDPCDQFG